MIKLREVDDQIEITKRETDQTKTKTMMSMIRVGIEGVRKKIQRQINMGLNKAKRRENCI